MQELKGKKVLFIGSDSYKDARKGMRFLIEAFTLLIERYDFKSNDITLLVAGHSDIDDDFIKENYVIYSMGYINDEIRLASCYQSADIFVCSSIEDSGPMMINESVVCGTPVVAFEMGVVPDLVIKDQTGYIAKNMDSNDLAFGINKLLKLNAFEYKRYSDNCRKIGLELCSSQKQASEFEKLIQLEN